MFKVIENKLGNRGELIYKTETKEFVSLPEEPSDISVSFIYFYLGFDSETRKSTQLWGYHNDFSWIKTNLIPPLSVEGRLLIQDKEIDGGDSIRISSAYDWTTFYDEESGWLKIGEETIQEQLSYVEFFKNSIAGLDSQGQIQEFWLRPKFH